MNTECNRALSWCEDDDDDDVGDNDESNDDVCGTNKSNKQTNKQTLQIL